MVTSAGGDTTLSYTIKNENNIFDPSNGGTGIKLKIPNPVEISPV